MSAMWYDYRKVQGGRAGDAYLSALSEAGRMIQRKYSFVVLALLLLVIVAGAVLFGGNDDKLEQGKLKPRSMGLAPYAYMPYKDTSLAKYSADTGIKNYFGAFVLGDDSDACVPAWDGTEELTSDEASKIGDEIADIQDAGGEFVV